MKLPPNLTLIEKDVSIIGVVVENVKVYPPSDEVGTILKLEVDAIEKSEAYPTVGPVDVEQEIEHVMIAETR